MSGWPRSTLLFAALASPVALLPATATATNGLHPRTKVVWSEGGACGLVVVRSEQTTINLPYALPDANQDGMMDTCDDDPTPDGCAEPIPNAPVGPDEVSDSRRHQFFAFCRQRPVDELLPNWVSLPDVQASAEVETCCDVNDCPGPMCPLVDEALVTPDDILDDDPTWDGCYARINSDDERKPINVATASQGVDWDVSGVEPGVYAIEGYTWEPPFNLWSRRPGYVKVIDEAADAKNYPAVAITGSSEDKIDDGIIDGCEKVTLSGCVDAGDGATIDVYWRTINFPGDPIEWHRIVADEPVQNGNFDIEWVPEYLPGGTLLVRVDVKAPCGTYTAHAPFAVEVLDGQECEDGGVFDDPPDDYVDDQDNRDENLCVAGSGDGDTDKGSCGCATGGLPTGLGLLALLPFLRRRRSRRG